MKENKKTSILAVSLCDATNDINKLMAAVNKIILITSTSYRLLNDKYLKISST